MVHFCGMCVAARVFANTKPEREEGEVAKEDRGFASMDRNKQREIASKGGRAAHQKGTAHEWTTEEAREAGRKGGMVSGGRRRAREQAAQQNRSGESPEREAGEERESESEGTETSSDASPTAV